MKKMYEKMNVSSCVFFQLAMLVSVIISVFCTSANAEVFKIECDYRLEVKMDQNRNITTNRGQARIGKNGYDFYRTWAEFTLPEELKGKTVKGVGFRVYNDWTGTKITSLRYTSVQPCIAEGNINEQHKFTNKYKGFGWVINPGDAWTPSETGFHRPDWSKLPRENGNTLIKDIQTHIDQGKDWFAVEFDCFDCVIDEDTSPNLRFPGDDDSYPESIVMQVETEEESITPAGDVDSDDDVDLRDTIICLQVACGMTPDVSVNTKADVNDDGEIGLEEAIYSLQVVIKRK